MSNRPDEQPVVKARPNKVYQSLQIERIKRRLLRLDGRSIDVEA
jgi:hypothetical protein